MKISLALGPRRTLSRQSAWGCFTTNLALPGFGSLMAGRRSGYPQAALGLTGLGLTMLFAARFFAWYFVNRTRITGDQEDPLETLLELWRAVRWPLLGIAVFLAGWLWALVTSWRILRAAGPDGEPRVPPQLK